MVDRAVITVLGIPNVVLIESCLSPEHSYSRANYALRLFSCILEGKRFLFQLGISHGLPFASLRL
jgi:hypothetical protein